MLKKSAQLLLISATLLSSLNVQAATTDESQYRNALAHVKAGRYSEGLPILKSLMLKNPEVSRYRYDYLAGLAWSQRDEEVITLSKTWKLDHKTPIYVLEAIGRSARATKNYERSLEAYSVALKNDPKRVYSQVGHALTNLYLGNTKEADELIVSLKDQAGFRQELERGFLDYYLARPELQSQAVSFIEKLRKQYPDNPSYSYQYITVLTWSGHPTEALEFAKTTPVEKMPPHILNTLGHAARDLHQYQRGLQFYAASLQKDPRQPDACVGFVMTLLDDIQTRKDASAKDTQRNSSEAKKPSKQDQEQLQKAVTMLAVFDPIKQNRLDIKEAWLRLQDTLREDDYKILKIARDIQEKNDPKNIPAVTAEIDALNRQGASHLAMSHPLFEQVRDTLKWDVKLSSVGQEVRAGQIEHDTQIGEARYQKSEGALQHANTLREALLTSQLPEKDFYVNRLDFDRMIVLNDLRHYEDVIQIYQELENKHVEIPYYAHTAAASAYLSTRNTAKARDVFQKALELKPHDINATTGLYYAYLANSQYEEALYIANWEIPAIKRDAQAMAAMAYAYTDRLQEAEKRMETLVKENPSDVSFHKNLAAVYRFRDKPRAAEEEYKWVETAQPNDLDVQIGRTYVAIDTQDYRKAEQSVQKAESLAPREESVKKVRRDWETHNLRELHVTFNDEISKPAGAVNGGRARVPQLGWKLYSQPLNYDWRIFTEGKALSSRLPATDLPIIGPAGAPGTQSNPASKTNAYYTGLGVEYRHLDNRVELSAGATRYANDASIDGVTSTNRAHVAGTFEHQFNDHWSVQAISEYNSLDMATPTTSSIAAGGVSIRANQRGLYGNRLALATTWAANESRRARLGLDFSRLNDGNRRWSWFAGWTERIISTPTYKLTASLEASIDGNSLPASDVSYYNPERQSYAGVEITQEWVIDRFYDRSWKHRLGFGAGKVYQRGFGSNTAANVKYDHIWDFSDRVNLDVGFSRDRRYYDGLAEYRNLVNSSLNWRF